MTFGGQSTHYATGERKRFPDVDDVQPKDRANGPSASRKVAA